jgi:hypothetical protein
VVKESDWKKFQSMIITLRERFLAKQNASLLKIIADPDRTETERFWDAFKRMKTVSKELAECLDDHSRSRMELHMRLMLRCGMLVQEDLVAFSEQLQQQLNVRY